MVPDSPDTAVNDGKSVNFRMKIKFNHPVTVYALQIGGWLPLPFTSCRMLLLDRNIVSTLKTIDGGSTRGDAEANKWWLDFLNSSRFMLNPILYAMEANRQRMPFYDEFRVTFDEASNVLTKACPGAQRIEFADVQYRAIYQTVLDFHERYGREREFLFRTVPLICQRQPSHKLTLTENQILRAASTAGLEKLSLVVVAALSCLYERSDGAEPRIGRNVIKPAASYSEQNAYNAIADLRALEFLGMANAFERVNTALCTRDKYLAAFWCAANVGKPRWEGTTFRCSVQPDEELFPRLQKDEIEDLNDRLRAYSQDS
jgi:hypothetical protein